MIARVHESSEELLEDLHQYERIERARIDRIEKNKSETRIHHELWRMKRKLNQNAT